MKANLKNLKVKRKNAINSIQNLLQIAGEQESITLIEFYQNILKFLEHQKDGEAIKNESLWRTVPGRWAITELLQEKIHQTLTNLRVYINFGLDNPLVEIKKDFPKITELLTGAEVEAYQRLFQGELPCLETSEQAPSIRREKESSTKKWKAVVHTTLRNKLAVK